MRARDLMSPDVISTTPEATVGEVLRLMRRTGHAGLPVVDTDGRLLGVVTETDMLALLLPEWLHDVRDLSFLPEDFHPLADALHRAAETKIADVSYNRDVHCAEEEDSALEVIRIIVGSRVRRVPVVRKGRLVGLISREDVARAIFDSILQEGSQQ